jgi:spermidine synthase
MESRMKATCSILAFFVTIFAFIWLKSDINAQEHEVIFKKDSFYHNIRVTEDKGSNTRFLGFTRKRGSQSAINLDDPLDLHFDYTKTAMVCLAFKPEPKNTAVIGVGGGTFVRYLRHYYPVMLMDLIEVDRDVIDVAKKYFSLEIDEGMQLYIRDARRHFKKSKQKYDLILLDAYNDENVPFHLTTLEFLFLVKSRMTEDGVVMANVWSSNTNNYFNSMIATYLKVFPNLYIFQDERGGNEIFIATLSEKELSVKELVARAFKLQDEKNLNIDLVNIIGLNYHHVTKPPENAIVLTDNYAPVNILKKTKP